MPRIVIIAPVLLVSETVRPGPRLLAKAGGTWIIGCKGPRRGAVWIARRGWSATENTEGNAMVCDRRGMAVVVLASCCAAAADEKATVPGAVTTPYPTILNLAVEWKIEGDDN